MEDEALVLLLIEKMRESGDILSHHGWLHLPDHKAGFSEEQQAIWQKQSRCLVTSRGGCVIWQRDGYRRAGNAPDATPGGAAGIITAIVKIVITVTIGLSNLPI